jgi:DNA-binding LytR/AlgR family response regulator
MRIAVCDDEQKHVYENEKQIRHWAEKNKISINVDAFFSAEEFLFRWSEGHPYDLAIFDIVMKKMTGMDLAKTIRKTDNDLQIIFITGAVEYVFDGYGVSAVNYLIKPFKPDLFFKTLDKVYAVHKQKEHGNLMVPQGDRLIRIPYPEIVYLEIRGHYFDIYTNTMGQFRTKSQMSKMLAMLDSSLFIQCHRSFIVNISHVSNLSRKDITLNTGVFVPLSLQNVQPVTRLFLEYPDTHGQKITLTEETGHD